MERVFLGWERPGLWSAADHLVSKYLRGGELDLSTTVIAVPGARAGRRLLEILVERAEAGGFVLRPPEISTVGELPEKLYEPTRPFASSVLRLLTWREALVRVPESELRALVPEPPPRDDWGSWLALAELVSRIHEDVLLEALRLADVATFLAGDGVERAETKWRALGVVEAEYESLLEKLGRTDPQLARFEAADRGRVSDDRDVVLLAVADVGGAMRKLLGAVNSRVTALVFAPAELAERFDDFGCVRAGAWRGAELEIDDERIEVVENASEQAAALVEAIRRFGPDLASDELTIGAPDIEVVPYITDVLERCGIRSHSAGGTPLRRTPAFRLLDALADFADGHRYREFAALARHPDLESWLVARGNGKSARGRNEVDNADGSQRGHTAWPEDLDRWASDHLPELVDAQKIPAELERLAGPLLRVRELVEESRDPRPLSEHARSILKILLEVYERGPLEPGNLFHEELLQVLSGIYSAVREVHELEGRNPPEVRFVDALRFVLSRASHRAVPDLPEKDAVEILGWLDLALDDAPALIVTGMNEGIVPTHAPADSILPESLRQRLGFTDGDRRYARDALAWASILATKSKLHVILGRRSARGDQLAPSRLLLACEPDRLPQRILRLFDERNPSPPSIHPPAGSRELDFPIPRPAPQARPLECVSVTAFRDYLACPFGFFLRHILGLRAVDDSIEELDALAFGNLAHHVLEEFAKSESACSPDERVIAATLDRILDEEIARVYGERARVVVRVQGDLLRERFHAFASWQANRTREGWRIAYTEVDIRENDGVRIGDPEDGVILRGRMDRVDWHPERDEWVVFDYKTSDGGAHPEAAHRKQGDWIDLQLPLYRSLFRQLGDESVARRSSGSTARTVPPPEPNIRPSVGYIILPRDLTKTGAVIAEWSEEDFASAEAKAREVARLIRKQVFWEPRLPVPPWFRDFRAIYQEDRFVSEIAAAGRDGEEPREEGSDDEYGDSGDDAP